MIFKVETSLYIKSFLDFNTKKQGRHGERRALLILILNFYFGLLSF